MLNDAPKTKMKQSSKNEEIKMSFQGDEIKVVERWKNRVRQIVPELASDRHE